MEEDPINLESLNLSQKNYQSQPIDNTNSDDDEEILNIPNKLDWDYYPGSCQRKYPLAPFRGYKLVEDGNELTTPDASGNHPKSLIASGSRLFRSKKKPEPKVFEGKLHFTVLMDFDVSAYDPANRKLCHILYKRVVQIISYKGAETLILRVIPQGERVFKVFKTPSFKRNEDLASKEYHNLLKLQTVGIACPNVWFVCPGAIKMSLIGKRGNAAPKLKDAELTEEEYELAYSQVLEILITLYKEAKLIHCYLNEDNILWYEKQCYVISVRRAISLDEVDSLKFLLKDCINITRFFENRCVKNVKSPYVLFEEISGCNEFSKYQLKKMYKKF